MYKKARAKINLTLNVLNKREDGYHNIESVFQKISLYDEMYLEKTNKHDDISITSNFKELEGESNIINKAYRLLKENFKEITGVNVKLKKNIPTQAGLAGGSTDCSAFIESMNNLFNLNLSKEQMKEIGVKLGADVPATFYNKPVIARGIGEKIEEINSKFKYYIVIIMPKFSCNTKKMYERLDKDNSISQKYNSTKMKETLESCNIDKLSENLYNVFESAVENIDKIKKEIMDVGSINSLMTGSGAAVYGIFDKKENAKKAYRILKEKYNTYYCISFSKQ